MAMVKIIDPSGWNWDRPVAMMIKVSRDGLVGQDRRDFIKTAGHQFLDAIDRIKFAKDEVPVHLIALGATEYWSPNRNGDGFLESTCRDHHRSFEKYARFYRNHKNTPKSPAYGTVKQSCYNEAMHRVELLCALNATKSAAERNKGFLADKELEKIANNESIPVSMACKILFDCCSACGHKAKTREEYCTPKMCKRGGCRDNLGRVFEDGHVLHVDNPNPTFFDISSVFRPADRTAYGVKADYLEKAASHQFMPGAEMAEMLGVIAPLELRFDDNDPFIPAAVRAQIKLACALARAEGMDLGPNPIFDRSVQTPLTQSQLQALGTPGSEKAASALAAMADELIFLPLNDFANWLGKASLVKSAAAILPAVYTRLTERLDLVQKIASNPFAPAFAATQSACSTAASLRGTHGLSEKSATDRGMLAAVRGVEAVSINPNGNSEAEKDAAAVQLAETYGLYKLAALHRAAGFDSNFNLTATLALAQNRS